ncbi:MAG: glycosyltransferase [Chitinophagaceae bacterium]|nr:MAG: glycosyltransferase [Chitinophagaceae bacterium]
MDFIFYLFVISFSILVFYQVFWFSVLTLYKGTSASMASIIDETPKVSVLICAKNEADNLQQNLPLIFLQKYPDFEVIVVDDRSTDDTYEVLKNFESKYKLLKIIRVSDSGLKGKRNALKTGLEHVNGAFVLLTDADCSPSSENWILSMLQSTENLTADVVLGSAPLKGNSLAAEFHRFETVKTLLLYQSAALHNFPYMGVGRNMLVRTKIYKEAFEKTANINVISGDDDLLINQLNPSVKVKINISEDALMHSKAAETLNLFFKKKRRHLSAGNFYSLKSKLYNISFVGSHVLTYLSFFILSFMNYEKLNLIFLMMFFNYFSGILVFSYIAITLHQKDLIKKYPVYDLLYSIYFLILGTTMIWKPQKWN